jgi:hypothetical protein
MLQLTGMSRPWKLEFSVGCMCLGLVGWYLKEGVMFKPADPTTKEGQLAWLARTYLRMCYEGGESKIRESFSDEILRLGF